MPEKKGVKEYGWLNFQYRNTGEPIRFPVGTIYGENDGPTLLVLGGMHGSEFAGIEAAIRLFNEVDPTKLKGVLKVGMMYNVPAFENNLGFLVPHDGKNPMGTFPGSRIGTYGEAMAFYFNQEVLSKCDYFVELHGGDIPESLTPFVMHLSGGDPVVDEKSRKMAEVYDIPLGLWRCLWYRYDARCAFHAGRIGPAGHFEDGRSGSSSQGFAQYPGSPGHAGRQNSQDQQTQIHPKLYRHPLRTRGHVVSLCQA